jgi:hypothetical protein
VGFKRQMHFTSFGDLQRRISESYDYDACLLVKSLTEPDPSSYVGLLSSNSPMCRWRPKQSKPATDWEARIDEAKFNKSSLNNCRSSPSSRAMCPWRPISASAITARALSSPSRSGTRRSCLYASRDCGLRIAECRELTISAEQVRSIRNPQSAIRNYHCVASLAIPAIARASSKRFIASLGRKTWPSAVINPRSSATLT